MAALERASRTDAAGNFLVLFTSGTTGAPKAISIGEALICQRVARVSARLGFGSRSRIFMSGLLNNTTGVIFSFGALLHDATLIFPHGRDVAAWPAQVAAAEATHIMLRPVSMKVFLQSAEAGAVDLSCLRTVAYGAAPMPGPLLEAGRCAIPCDWVQGYGLSETYGPFCWLDEAAHREFGARAHTYRVGRHDDTLEVDLAPLPGHPSGVGEVVLRGAAMMEGYYDASADVVQPPGDWLRTGDVGAWSPEGELLLKGRIGDSLMSANGHRIYPAEVEAVLTAVPDVDEVVLVGVTEPGAPQGRPVACISGPLSQRDPTVIRQAVTGALERALSREKWPELVYASKTAFPKGGNDKVLRSAVVRQVDRGGVIEL
jgi:acyl-CoA synthetase (AMP-forming)/AMP-acid ligase II